MAQKTTVQKQVDRFDTNYAAREEVARRFLDHVLDASTAARTNRRALEEQWLEDERLWSCRLDEEGYQGHSNLFVPELHAQVELSVEKALSALFPVPDYLNAVPLPGTDPEKAKKIQHAVYYELEERNKLSAKFGHFERSKILYGTSVLRPQYRYDYIDAFFRDKNGRPIKKKIPKKVGVYIHYPDLFRWYIYPETSTLESAYIIFEDAIVNKAELVRSGLYVNLPDIKDVSSDIEHDWVDHERFDFIHLSKALTVYKDSCHVTEYHTMFEINRNEGPVPVRGFVANNNTVIRLVRNPEFMQSQPYLATRYIQRPGNVFYGLSLPDKIRSQQYQMNDLTNHTMDSLNYALNPIAIVDPALAGDLNSMRMRPAAKWLASPAGVQFAAMPDVSGAGLRAMQEIRGQIAQFSDNQPGIAPQLTGKARTATQAQMIGTAVSTRQRINAKEEEADIISPLCLAVQMLLVQYQTTDYQIKVQGPDLGSWKMETVKPEDMIAEVDWVWKGATEEERTAVRSQQLLALYNEALKTAAIMPGEIDLPKLFIRVAKDAFRLTDIDDLFKTLREKKTVSPDAENYSLLNGEDVPVNYGDIDDLHIQKHKEAMDEADEDGRLAIAQHIEKHVKQAAAKQEVKDLQARLQTLQSMSGQGPEQPERDGRTGPQVPSPMEGNAMQTSAQDVFSGMQAT